MSTQRIGADRLSTINDLCLDKILSLLSPRELLAVGAAGSRRLRVEAEADTYWEKFLTRFYQIIIERATEPLNLLTFKQLYCRLVTRPLILYEGRMILSHNRDCGKSSYMIGARSLWITDDHGWVWGPDGDSRFPDVAMLLHVGQSSFHCSLETRLLSDKTDYFVYLLFKIAADGYGFKSEPVKATFYFFNLGEDVGAIEYEKGEATDIYFDVGDHVDESVNVPHHRDDSWMEVEIAKICIHHSYKRNVFMVLAGDERPPMHGLILEGIEVRPKI